MLVYAPQSNSTFGKIVIIHFDDLFTVLCNVEIRINKCILIQYLDIAHPVNTVLYDGLALVGVCGYIIAVIVPHQYVW